MSPRWSSSNVEILLARGLVRFLRFHYFCGVGAGMKLKVIACKVLFREICLYAAQSRHVVDLAFLPQGLHNEPDDLRTRVQEQIRAAEEEDSYDAILLGYALCSNGVVGLKAKRTPLVIPRGHDCITILLGSKEWYRSYFDSHRGIYWYSAGWIERNRQPSQERYEEMLARYREKYGEENAQYLMEMEQGWYKEYAWATYIDWGFPESERYRQYTKECAQYLGWNYDEVVGDQHLVRDMLNGNWDKDSVFLVVPPGHQVSATYDGGIIRYE